MSDMEGLEIVTVSIDGMHCDRCVSLVAESLHSVDGVDFADVEVGRAEVHLLPQLASRTDVERAIIAAGYTVRKHQPKKGPIGRFLDRMIKSNEQNFGHERLDCCNLSNKKNP